MRPTRLAIDYDGDYAAGGDMYISPDPEAGITTSKLYPGVGAVRVMKRPKLAPADRFRDGAVAAAVLCAPAGYGKSTLMISWHAQLSDQGFSCTWLSLDAGDDDPARLLRHLVAVFQHLEPAIGRAAMSVIAADLHGSIKPALESLAADLGLITKRSVIFFDDLHTVTSAPSLEILDWVLHYAPATCQFVIATREEPCLRLDGLRVRQRLAEYGIAELRFSDEEANRFFDSRLGHSLDAADLQQLVKKTDGWPAALELAALALFSESDRTAVIERFTGSESDVVNYFGEVVLDRLDARTRQFVLKIALFDRIDADLAAHLTGVVDAAALMAGLHAGNLFLIPLGRASGWFRFHPLVAEFFRDYFRRQGGQAAPFLLLGARWLFERGHAEEAVDAAIRAEEWETATRWVAETVETLVYQHGYHHTILKWMKQLPAQWVDRFPTIRIHYAFALAFSPYHHDVEEQVLRLESVREFLQEQPNRDEELIRRIQCEVELQKVLSAALRDAGLLARTGAHDWLERWPDAPLIRRGTVANILTLGHKTAGEIDAGLAVVARSRIWLQQAEGWYSLAWTEYLAALLNMKRGDYFEARRICEGGLELLQSRLDGHPVHASMFHAILATVAYEFDELAKAREHLDLCLPRVAEFGQADAVLMAFLTAAKLERVQRSETAGLDRLHEGQELAQRRGFERVTVSLAAEECSWHSRAERFEEARRVAVRYGFDRLPPHGADTTLRSGKAFLVASRYLLRRSPEEVRTLIDGPIARCAERGLHRRWVELLLIKTLAYRQQREISRAVACLKEAMTIAAERGYFRVILDEAADIGSMLDRLDSSELRTSPIAPLVQRLTHAMREALSGKGPRGVRNLGPVDELSKREIAILKRLESDLSNHEIADAIFISAGTLKWHLHNIYGKLGVKNRLSAVTKARGLKLL